MDNIGYVDGFLFGDVVNERDSVHLKCHSEKQERGVFSESKITALVTGIQFGKTRCGSLWIKRHLHRYTNPLDTFLVTAPTYKILEQSTLPAFMQLMDDCGDLNRQRMEFKVKGGGTVYFRTGKEPDSIVGLTNVRAIWGDEAGKYSLYFWENLQARASFKDCPIMLTTSPYTMNWLYKEIIKPAKQGKRNDVTLIQAASNENPYFPKEEYERRRLTMDPRRFNAIYGGEFEKMHGLVYDCFDPDVHIVSGHTLDAGTKYYAGIDWGYSDPFVCVIHGITQMGVRYQVGEFYKTGLTVTDMIQACRQKKTLFNISMFYADPSQPGYIEEFNRNGLPCMKADNDIRRGIDCVYQMLRERQLIFFDKSNPYTLDELENYHYEEPRDLNPNEDSKETLPVGQNDHALDALRYVTIMTRNSHIRSMPKVPVEGAKKKENNVERIARLKKGKTNKHTENW